VATPRPADSADVGFTLDEEVLRQRREASARRLQTVQIPFFRAVGFAMLCLIEVLQDLRVPAAFPPPGLQVLLAVNVAYAAISWWLLRAAYGRTGRLDLDIVFLHLDALVWLPNVHHLEQSHLFFAYLMLIRVADQTGFGFRRALYFAHVVPLAYLAYAAWAAFHGPPGRTPDRLVIAASMYLLGAYLAATASVTERLRNRTRQAVRTARELVSSLEQKTRALEAQAAELEEARRAAEQASVAKSQFLATVSHEIRTPLNGVLGTTDLLLDTPLSPAQRRYAETAHRSATSLLALIDDVLDLSRIEAGKLVLHPMPFDLRGLALEAVELMAAAARDKPVRLRCRVSRAVPPLLEGDPLRLRQLLVNLLHNAVKFTDEGEVVLEVVVLGEGPEALELRFEVRDSGIGIHREQLESVFDAVTQADGSTTRRHGGSGLGLAIVRQLADLMGGRIEVESEPGAGSAFAFVVVLKKVPERPAASPAPLAALEAMSPARTAATSGIHVLLAEDDAVNQLVVTEMLRKLGCRVDVVAEGDSACEAVERVRYDLVLMDCHMPGTDGYAATERIRRGEAGGEGRLAIVALTADALAGSRERCLACGMDDFLTKPVTLETLRTAVERWAGRPTHQTA
jgi:signal transduction histidine kinase/CheY-like chemotaxis protein